MANTIQQKLQLKPGGQIVLLNAPSGYAGHLSSEMESVAVSEKRAGEAVVDAEAVLVFVNNLDETSRLVPDGIRAVKQDGLLWVAYPKGSSKVKTDVNRDKLWAAVEPTGWRPVRQVALDEIWSALRFRPAELVGK